MRVQSTLVSRLTPAQSSGRRERNASKMQCFICVTYMFFVCSAYPPRAGWHQERSLFHDVIESLKIRAQLPEVTNRNEENNLGQIYERYEYDNDELNLPNNAEFIPRRNDRIALPPLKYRIPKMLGANETESNTTLEVSSDLKEEIVIFISTTEVPKISTQKIKRKTTRQPNKKKPNFGQETDDGNKTFKVPIVNTMADQSHIGNKDIHMIVTPHIVVNFRSNENNKNITTKFNDERNVSDNTPEIVPQNIFNIHQEINLDKDVMDFYDKKSEMNDLKRVKQDIKVVSRNVEPKVEEDMMMCETATWAPEKNNRNGRKMKNVLQILFAL